VMKQQTGLPLCLSLALSLSFSLSLSLVLTRARTRAPSIARTHANALWTHAHTQTHYARTHTQDLWACARASCPSNRPRARPSPPNPADSPANGARTPLRFPHRHSCTGCPWWHTAVLCCSTLPSLSRLQRRRRRSCPVHTESVLAVSPLRPSPAPSLALSRSQSLSPSLPLPGALSLYTCVQILHTVGGTVGELPTKRAETRGVPTPSPRGESPFC
jgi:hypothetical protein